ncbi:hypothetical protein [Pedobacter nutrimenti]|uniref:Conjugative transposon TraK protein n=1 Tax=Pedobacter nutrimenti TaxID=1241337 RepID=A0A318U8V5_9SPHI|nr:hypothetical protein [Pedobacter nutrimenti]PYF68439.1 hypothetical protein B0O44_11223 [Pedobacter nutrimenti]
MDTVKNFSKTYDTMRMITIVAICVLAFTNLAWTYFYYLKDEEVGKKVIVVTDFGSFSAKTKKDETIDQFEARNFVEVFMQNMFAHDGSSFKRNVEAALNMINKKDGMQIYSDFKTGQVLETYVKYDSRSRIEIDSIKLDMDVRPLSGKVYAKQFTVYAGKELMQPIAAKFSLDRIDRSPKKPYGLLINSFSFINYNPTQTEVDPNVILEKQRIKQLEADSIINTK